MLMEIKMLASKIIHNGNEIRNNSRVLVEFEEGGHTRTIKREEATVLIHDCLTIVVQFDDWSIQMNGEGVQEIENNMFGFKPARIIGEVL